MEVQVVKELIDAFKEAGLTSLSLKCKDFKLELGKEMNTTIVTTPIENHKSYEYNQEAISLVTKSPDSNQHIVSQETASNHKIIKSPIVGTFYAASSPTGKPFVEVGSYVKKGEVVCVIEAMKLMNEIEAEEDGEIIEILATNEEMVEYDQPLFVMR